MLKPRPAHCPLARLGLPASHGPVHQGGDGRSALMHLQRLVTYVACSSRSNTITLMKKVISEITSPLF